MDLTDDSLITVVAVRSVLARLGANVRAGGAGSDGVLEPLSLQMFAVRYRARVVLTVQLTPALARKRSSS